jgi:hypothetical protein
LQKDTPFLTVGQSARGATVDANAIWTELADWRGQLAYPSGHFDGSFERLANTAVA